VEATLRLAIFIGIFAIVAVLEIYVPKRPKLGSWKQRWVTNLSLLLIDIILQRATLGAAAFLTALYAEEHGWGLFALLAWPAWVKAVLGFLLLDFAIYLQHVLSHALPVFWRLHRVHHADLDMDLTTGIRFHPLEILISLVYKSAVVAALGIDPWVVLVFEAVLNASATFTHGNIRLPQGLDQALRTVICTPDMHRIHHSVLRSESDTNFGFFLSIWDRLCGTFRRDPARGQLGMELGLADVRDPAQTTLPAMLVLPLKPQATPADRKK
jgi:sterol desaturase/sphingolipid hydroxylase (fatty acid hydroxylase superfamily)